jgi:hypothetical protein
MAKIAAGCGTFYGATTLGIKAITIMTRGKMPLSLMAPNHSDTKHYELSIMTLAIITLNIMTQT